MFPQNECEQQYRRFLETLPSYASEGDPRTTRSFVHSWTAWEACWTYWEELYEWQRLPLAAKWAKYLEYWWKQRHAN